MSVVCDFCALIAQFMKNGPLDSYTEWIFKLHLERAHSRGWQKMEIAI